QSSTARRTATQPAPIRSTGEHAIIGIRKARRRHGPTGRSTIFSTRRRSRAPTITALATTPSLAGPGMIGAVVSAATTGSTTTDKRPDGTDVIFGGAGTHVGRNDTGVLSGVASNQGHARDSDVILGDNGDIFRIVGTTHTDTGLVNFNYDLTSTAEDRGTLRIVVRAVRQLDYTPGGADFTATVEVSPADVAINPISGVRDIGAADELH